MLKLQESTSARSGLFTIATLTGDAALADAQVQAAKGRRDEIDLTGVRAQAAGYKGQMKEAERLTDEMFRQVQGTNRMPLAAEGFIGAGDLAGRDRSQGRRARELRSRRAAEDHARQRRLRSRRALGDPERTEDGAAVRRSRAAARAKNVRRRRRWWPTSQPGARSSRSPKTATRKPTTWRSTAGVNPREHNAPFVAGVAALRLQRWDDAAAALEDDARRPEAARHLAARRGRLHHARARARRRAPLADARQAYDEAFRIWKDADPDMPLLVEAKQEYEALR